MAAGLPLKDAFDRSGCILAAAEGLACMDLLISVDTMMAHLGGALGKPVWLLLPFQADWRWMLDRVDSPWYPGMRLFRQPYDGEWGVPVSQVFNALQRLVPAPVPASAPDPVANNKRSSLLPLETLPGSSRQRG